MSFYLVVLAIVVLTGRCDENEHLPGNASASGAEHAFTTLALAASAEVRNMLCVPGATDSAADSTDAPLPTTAELAQLRSNLIVPVAGVSPTDLLDTFDEMRGPRRHDALDIPAPRGTPVLSATEGRLLKLFTSANGGLMVYAADVTERFILMYAHLDRYADGLAEGVLLRRGQVIGYVGTSGNAPLDMPHLHFAIVRSGDIRQWWRGIPVDPRPLLVPEGR